MPTNVRSHEVLVGLYVTDDELYSRYRQGMAPILEAHGGSFRYDLRISEVLKSETADHLNRLFIISFPNAETMATFFSNEDYLKVRREFFEPSVQSITTVAEYDRTA